MSEILPLISVIVPVYNQENVVSRCVRSLLDQTYQNLEIILVNDGSADKSGDICDSFAREDQRVHVIHKENGGTSSARNVGLSVANGEFIGFVDGDDYISAIMYEQLLTIVESYDVDMVCCACCEVGNMENMENRGGANPDEHITLYDREDGAISLMMGHSMRKKYFERLRQERNFSSQDLSDYRTHSVSFTIWDKLYKREIIKEFFFDEHIIMVEDTLFMAEVIGKVNKIAVTDSAYYYHVFYSDSFAHVTSFEKLRSLLLMSKMYYKVLVSQFPGLKSFLLNTYTFMQVATLNRLLGYGKFSNPASKNLRRVIYGRLSQIRKDTFYKDIEPELKFAMAIARYCPILLYASAVAFKLMRRIQYHKRYKK